jgi:hypothetical protein
MVRVFSRGYRLNRRDFGVNELLYDIAIVRVESVESSRQKKNLLYIKETLWQVESEFALNSRQSLIDFNKLVLGSAQNKLFIGPLFQDPDSLRKVIMPAAAACSGNVFAAFLAHPSEWNNNPSKPEVFHFTKGSWTQYER